MEQLSPFLFALMLPLVASCTTGAINSLRSGDPSNRSEVGAAPVVERQRSITGRISIPTTDEGINVKITTSSGDEIWAAWPGWSHGMNVNTRWQGTKSASLHERKARRDDAASMIDPSQEYHIELLADDILRISRHGQIVIDASVCQVHEIPMKREMEEVSSADAYPESFFPQQKRKFPNDGNFYSGCSQQSDPTWRCPECRRAYETWSKRHESK